MQTSIVQANNPPSTNDPGVVAKATEPEQTRPQQERRIKNERSTIAKAPNDDVTRSGDAVANLKLSEIKKIYIEMRGDAASDELRSLVVESLNSSGVVSATNTDDADAALKIMVSQNGASAQLVNARGTVLWSKAGRGAVSEIVNDLLSAIRK